MSLRDALLLTIALLLPGGFATAQAPAGSGATGGTAARSRGGGTESTATAAGGNQDDLSDSELGRSGLLSDEQTLFEERYGYGEGERPSRTSPHENRDQSYWSFGGGYRYSFVPRGMIELFTQRAPTGIGIPQYQIDIDRRRNGVDLIMSLYYGNFSFTGPFLGNGHSSDDTSIIDSNLRTVGASVSMLWSSNFSDVVALQYGFDLGLGLLFGHATRTEAYPSEGGPHTTNGWAPCVGPTAAGQPGSAQSTDTFDSARYATLSTIDSFCGAPHDTNPAGGFTDEDGKKGEHYGVNLRNMLDGGKVPFFNWRLAPRLSLRIKPIRQIIVRLDAGFDFGSGIFLGAGLQYGF